MLNKCANPACSATFRSLRDGRVFVIELVPERQRQYFWLCNFCSRTMTVIMDKEKGFQVVALPANASAVRSVSLDG